MRARRFTRTLAISALVSLVAACAPPTSEGTTSTTGTMTTESVSTTPASNSTTVGTKIPVIVDYSPTVSDVGGLMYLLDHPSVQVLAISLPVTGEAGCDVGMEVTLGLLAEFEREEIPVACDAERPDLDREWPEEFIANQGNLTAGLPEAKGSPSDLPAPELIAEAVATSDRPVVIWAVAPLTNVARALDRHPDIADGIDRVVIMGGAVDVPGNTASQGAEWNFWIDPTAAAKVLSSGVAITLVSLDATNQVPVPPWYQRALEEAEETVAVARLTEYVSLFPSVTAGFYYFWDELAASVITNPDLVTTEVASLTVTTTGSDAGETVRDDAGSAVTLSIGVTDPNLFYQEFLSTLAGTSVAIGSEATDAERAYFEGLELAMSDAVTALEVAFSSGVLFGEVYDPEAVTTTIDGLLTAQIEAIPRVESLDPPDSLSGLHEEYLVDLRELEDIRDEIIDVVSGLGSWDELDAELSSRWPDIQAACTRLADEAEVLGLQADLPC